MKLYTWREINTYPYAGGIVTVLAENKNLARAYADALLSDAVYRDAGYDLSGEPEVQDLAPGVGTAYYWEE